MEIRLILMLSQIGFNYITVIKIYLDNIPAGKILVSFLFIPYTFKS